MENNNKTMDPLDLDPDRFNVWNISAYICGGILLSWHLDISEMFTWRGLLTVVLLSLAMANFTIGTRLYYMIKLGQTPKRFNHWLAAGVVLCVVLFASLRNVDDPLSLGNFTTLALIVFEMFFAFLGARHGFLERQKGN